MMPDLDQLRPNQNQDPFYARMVLVYRYGALAFVVAGLAWAVVFSKMGWWGVVALDFAIVARGHAIYLQNRRGHFTAGLLAGQAALAAIAITMALVMDVPTDDYPRVSHLYLLVIAALGYLNYQRQKSAAQAVLIGVCLAAFVVFASAPLANPFMVDMPDNLRVGGTWANALMATAMLAACIHAMHAEFVRRSDFSRDLTAALWNDEFRLLYQPQVDVDQATIGAEALIRWDSPRRGEVSPVEFVPRAEQLGLMPAIGGWVMEKGCETLAEWARRDELRHLTLSVNVSASQLVHEDFEKTVRDTIERTGADPRRLTLEITESMLLTEMEPIVARLERLRELGLSFALDDFGTGYSSLSYLRRLPVQQIKIDRSFVQDAASSLRGAQLVKNVIHIGRDLGLEVLAEGIETLPQHALLSAAGAKSFQGYLYGKPMPRDDFEARVAAEGGEAKRAGNGVG